MVVLCLREQLGAKGARLSPVDGILLVRCHLLDTGSWTSTSVFWAGVMDRGRRVHTHTHIRWKPHDSWRTDLSHILCRLFLLSRPLPQNNHGSTTGHDRGT